MAKRGLLLLAAAALLAAGTLLPASSALASKQAVVRLTGFEGFFFTGYNFRTTTATGTATVYTTTTPTPRIVWPAKILSGMSTQIYSVTTTPNGSVMLPFTNTIFASAMNSFYNLGAVLSKSHAGAAAVTTTTPNGFAGSIILPADGKTATTLCFASNPPAIPNANANATLNLTTLPGACFPRYGMISRTPGPKKFGGVARLLRRNDFIATTIMGSPSGLSLVSQMAVTTARLLGSAFPGNYGILQSGIRTNTAAGIVRQTQAQVTTGGFSTGMVQLLGGPYPPDFSTGITTSGSHNFSTAKLTGMVSLVQPAMSQIFRRTDGVYGGRASSFANMRYVVATFLPEPGVTLLLACGGLGLALFGALRRR